MNSNEKIKRIKRYSGIASKAMIFFEILWVVMVIVISVILYKLGTHVLSVEQLEGWDMVFGGKDITSLNGAMLPFMIACIVAKCGIYLAAMENLRYILRDISHSETPFEAVHVRRMKRIAILIFAGSFINFLSVQGNEWLVAVLVWFLSMIFDYGCELQRESDETL